MDETRQKLAALYEIGRHLIDQVETGRLVDQAGNRFDRNVYFIEFKRLVETPESVNVDPEFQAFCELLDRRGQIDG